MDGYDDEYALYDDSLEQMRRVWLLFLALCRLAIALLALDDLPVENIIQ